MLERIEKYNNCIDEFIDRINCVQVGSLTAVLLHGGLAREKTPISDWSDIDLVIIVDPNRNATQRISEIKRNTEIHHGIRLDVNLIYTSDIDDNTTRANIFNSEILNALSMRSSVVIWGAFDGVDIPLSQGFNADLTYISTTISLFRRYLIEAAYSEETPENFGFHIQRLTRWTFSMVRASLRMEGVYIDPYEDTANYFSSRSYGHVPLLRTLSELRRNFYTQKKRIDEDYYASIIPNIEMFVEEYVSNILRKKYRIMSP